MEAPLHEGGNTQGTASCPQNLEPWMRRRADFCSQPALALHQPHCPSPSPLTHWGGCERRAARLEPFFLLPESGAGCSPLSPRPGGDHLVSGLDKPREGLCSVIRNFPARARFLCIMARGAWGAGGGGQEASEIQIPPNLLAFACLHQFHFAKADLNSDPSGREEGAGSLGEKAGTQGVESPVSCWWHCPSAAGTGRGGEALELSSQGRDLTPG